AEPRNVSLQPPRAAAASGVGTSPAGPDSTRAEGPEQEPHQKDDRVSASQHIITPPLGFCHAPNCRQNPFSPTPGGTAPPATASRAGSLSWPPSSAFSTAAASSSSPSNSLFIAASVTPKFVPRWSLGLIASSNGVQIFLSTLSMRAFVTRLTSISLRMRL